MQARKARLTYPILCVNDQSLSEHGRTQLLPPRHPEISWKVLSGPLPRRFRAGVWASRWAGQPVSLWIRTASRKPCRSNNTIRLRPCSVSWGLATSKLQVRPSSALRHSSTRKVGVTTACPTSAQRCPWHPATCPPMLPSTALLCPVSRQSIRLSQTAPFRRICNHSGCICQVILLTTVLPDMVITNPPCTLLAATSSCYRSALVLQIWVEGCRSLTLRSELLRKRTRRMRTCLPTSASRRRPKAG